MKTGYKVCDAMTERPITTSPNSTLRECADLMIKNQVGSVVVVENDILKGILTESDFAKVISANLDTKKSLVKSVMSKRVVTITPDKDISDALEVMKKYDFKHLPVVQGKKIIGFLTLKDVLRIQPQLLDLILERLEIRELSRKPIASTNCNEGLCQVCGNFDPDLHELSGTLLCFSCYKQLSEKKKKKR